MKAKIKFPLIILMTPLIFCIFSLLSFSQEKEENYNLKIPEFPSPPKIDGKLENPLWTKGVTVDAFTQYEPQEGAEPSEKTVAYLGHDKNNLYIAFRCFDSNPKAIRACLTQRDKVFGDDEVTIYLDTFNDKKRAFVFQVNPCGIQTDGIYTEIRRRGRGRGFWGFDRNYDTFFLSNAHIDDQGFTVELAIPFKSIRFPNTPTQKWGMQIMRTIRRKNEEIYWYPRSRDVNGFLVQSGTIEIDGLIEKGKNLEIMPVFTGMKEDDQEFNPEFGLNAKYGITSDLTADVTYNPDFSQVEADMPQIDVNQRYALYYPEKRPFFLEGKDIFDTPLELVYTRKIVNPQWGIKLTGKVGKTTIGFLSAYDENPPGIKIWEEEEEDEEDEDEEEEDNPYKSMVNVFRLKRDLFPESHIGFILTDKEMGLSWNSISSNYNRVAGIDGHFKFMNYYRFSFQILGSQSRFEGEKTGFVPAMKFNLSRRSRHLTFSADWTSIRPDFEASTGFFRRKNIQSFNTRISYAFLPQKEFIVDIRPSLEYRRIYDFDNTLTDEELSFRVFISGWRQTHLWATFSTELERYEGIDFHKKGFRAHFNSDPLSWLSGEISYSFGDAIYYDDPYLGYKTSIGLELTLKPLTNLRLYYDLRNDNFCKKKGGEKEYHVNIISQRINYQISRTLSLRLITDYNDYHKELYNSFLLNWELRPGTVFYIGVDDNQERDDSGIFRGEGRYYFIKFSYWWRI